MNQMKASRSFGSVMSLRSNSFWVAVLAVLLIVCAAIMIALKQTPARSAHIYREGTLIESVNLTALSDSFSYIVEKDGRRNVIEIENGRIRVSEANCPDELCVRQGWIDGGIIPIVCLPHQMVIKFGGGGTNGLDAVASAWGMNAF